MYNKVGIVVVVRDKLKKCLCFARPCSRARETANCYDPENISPNTTRHIEWTTASSEEEYYRTRHDFGSSAPPYMTHLSPAPRLHNKIASPSQQRVAAGHMNRQQDNRLHFTGTLAGHHPGANLSGTWSVLVRACVCVCSVCGCVGARTCKLCVCVCVRCLLCGWTLLLD